MNYSQVIHKLFNANQLGGVKFGLSNMLLLLEALNHPENAFKSIHVAGTNGKGSVTTKIAKALACSHAKVGLFTSPHINSFRERIQINNSFISEEDTEKLLNRIFDVQEKLGIQATFFELTTLLGFLYFAESGVEYAVIETGLGGRLDATNVLQPELSIITSISFDHTEILGNTLEAIAKEKAGIIKKEVPILIGPRVPRDVIQPIALHHNAPLYVENGIYSSFPEENNAIARAAMNLLCLPEKAIAEGLNASPPCRFEIVRNDPPIVCDVAHNPDGIHALFNNIQKKFPGKSLHVVLGLSKSKDLEGCFQILAKQKIKHLYLVQANSDRGASPWELKQIALSMGIPEESIMLFSSVREGVKYGKEHQEKSLLLITGTFFIMGEARRELGIWDICDSLDLNEPAPTFDSFHASK